MKTLSKKTLVVTLIVLGLYVSASPQGAVSDVPSLGNIISASIHNKKPDWELESLTPSRESQGVVIQQWTLNKQSVRITLVPHSSADDASRAVRDLGRDNQTKEPLSNLGDEGLSWGRGTVTFRKGQVTINVNAVIRRNHRENRENKEGDKILQEERKVCREFARIIADAIGN
jgi:hypothetical protein